MESGSVRSSLGCAAVLWLLLASSTAAAEGPVVQRIGEPGSIAAAVAAAVTVVPLSPDRDARTTPIILAAGKAFVTQDGKAVDGLEAAEQMALREAYDAGQPILLLDASTHDIEALHMLLEAGVALESSTDPVVLAYALRQENGVPSARLVTHPPVEDGLALSDALEIVIEELTHPPAAPEDDDATAGPVDWKDSPVQKFTLTSTADGTYNTPVEIYTLHSCQENKDYYLVNTGGDWTPTQARYESASKAQDEISLDPDGNLIIDWQPNEDHCEAGVRVFGDTQICRYTDYPHHYAVDIQPPDGPTVVLVNQAPAGDQGLSAFYESGFSFSIGGGVEVSGDGPGAGFQAGVTWDNTVSTPVPPLVIEAARSLNGGAFTQYLYCTSGDTVENCLGTIQMTGASGTCRQFVVGQPQEGQRSGGRLRNVAQTVNWQVDPATYTGSTFDIEVTWAVQLMTSTSRLWWGYFTGDGRGPQGNCNFFGCSCDIESVLLPLEVSHTFKVPLPSSSQCPS